MNNIKKVLWGLVLVAAGIVLLLDNLKVINIDFFFTGWWCAVIILIGLIECIGSSNKKDGLVIMAIGAILWCVVLELFSFELFVKVIIPVLIILLGLSFILSKYLFKKNRFQDHHQSFNHAQERICFSFGEQKHVVNNEAFNGCLVDVKFGALDLDISNAILQDETHIEVNCQFGGVCIRVGNQANVVVDSHCAFGGVDNHTIYQENALKTIYVRVNCQFGGIEIK